MATLELMREIGLIVGGRRDAGRSDEPRALFWPRQRPSKIKIEFGERSIPPTLTAVRDVQQRLDRLVDEANETNADGPPELDDEQSLAGFREGVELLLELTIDLPDRRLKPLMPPWSDALDDRLRREQLRILADTLNQRIERELREYPGKRLIFELGEDAPDDVRKIFDRLSHSEARLSYVVLPNTN